jgi:hypothetical protein
MQLETLESIVDTKKEAVDVRLKDFKAGCIVNFHYKGKDFTGKVNGFSDTDTLNTELVWIEIPDNPEEVTPFRCDEVTFIATIKPIKKKYAVKKRKVTPKASEQPRSNKLGKPKQGRSGKKVK